MKRDAKIQTQRTQLLKELSHGILSYFEHRQNYLEIEGNLNITLHKDRKYQRDDNKP